MNLWRIWLRSSDGRKQQAEWRKEYARHRMETEVMAVCLEDVDLDLPYLIPPSAFL